jgi:Domain of unknown function (DUF4386)
MDSLRKTRWSPGALPAHFVSIPTLVLYRPVHDRNYILGPGRDTAGIVGGLPEMIVALACIGTAAALYPVVKRQNEGITLGFVGARVLKPPPVSPAL